MKTVCMALLPSSFGLQQDFRRTCRMRYIFTQCIMRLWYGSWYKSYLYSTFNYDRWYRIQVDVARIESISLWFFFCCNSAFDCTVWHCHCIFMGMCIYVSPISYSIHHVYLPTWVLFIIFKWISVFMYVNVLYSIPNIYIILFHIVIMIKLNICNANKMTIQFSFNCEFEKKNKRQQWTTSKHRHALVSKNGGLCEKQSTN